MAVEAVKDLLARYRRYLVVMDQWAATWDEDCLDLLSPGEAFDILTIRDRLAEAHLTPAQRRELQRLDDLLVKYGDVVSGNAPPAVSAPHSRWWWHLEHTPVVRHQGRAGHVTAP